jgi:hypothetical protein
VGSNKSKRSRSSSGKGSSSGSFKPGDLFGGSGGGLVPVFAIVCGVLIGMGGAYVVKRVIFGGNKKPRPEIAMIEEGDRSSGRTRLKREARIRPVETADVNDSIQYVEQPPMIAEPPPPPPPAAEPRSLPRADPLPPEPAPRPRRTVSAPAPSKAPIRVTPPPRPAPTVAMLEPTPEPVVEEPRQPPRFVTIRNLTYSRPLFNRCPEDCLLLFRTADGGVVKAKLKKSSFMRVLSSNLAYADIDGYESVTDGERVVVVKSIRGMPVAPPPPPPAVKTVEKVAETPKVEKKKERVATEPSTRRKSSGEDSGDDSSSDSNSLRNRLEGVSKAKKKDDIEDDSDGDEEEGTSFQNRLKRSLD